MAAISSSILIMGDTRVSASAAKPSTRCSPRSPAEAERPGEGELVAVRIGHVKVSLAPFRVARRRVRPASRCNETPIQRIDIGLVKDDASPPGPAPSGRLENKIEKIVAGAQAGERRIFAAMQDLEADQTIEPYSALHVARGKRGGADPFDHDKAPSLRDFLAPRGYLLVPGPRRTSSPLPRSVGSGSMLI